MSNFSSSTTSGGDDALATQYNNLRKDTIENAGDYVTSTGSANAYVISVDGQITAYAAGQRFKFKANFTNTGAATLNVNGLGAKTIKKHGSVDLESGDIQNGQIVDVIYDGTNFQIISQLGTYLTTAAKSALSGGTSSDADAYHTHNNLQYFDGVGVGNLHKTWWHITLPFETTSYDSTSYTPIIWKLNNALSGGTVYRIGYLIFTPDVSTSYTGPFLNTQFWDDFTGKNVIMEVVAKINSLSSTTDNFGLGFADAYTDFATYNSATGKQLAFVVDGSGNLYAKTSGGGGGTDHTETAISGVTLTNKNRYRIEFNVGSNAKFYVNGVLKATITTTLPSSCPLYLGAIANDPSSVSLTKYADFLSQFKIAIEL